MIVNRDEAIAQPAEQDSHKSRRDLLINSAALASMAGVAGLFSSAIPAAAQTTTKEAAPASDKSLYDRVGGIFAIAAVMNTFSDAIIQDPVAGQHSKNPALRDWHTKSLDRLAGLKFMRTLWVANISGGPFQYTPTVPGSDNLGLENAHKTLKISPAEFDAVAGVLSRTLDHFKVPALEKGQVLGAFSAHKDEVTKGYRDSL